MSKINHIEMGAEVMALDVIEVKKGFLGMSTKLIYKPTNSTVKVKTNEYTVEDGKRLEKILNTEPENIEATIQNFPVSNIGMGNVKLDACISDDCQFVAVQLLSFKDFNYQPISGVKVYTGKAAKAIAKLF